MNQVVLVGKLESKTWIEDKLVLNIKCETRINGKFIDTVQQASITENFEMAKKFDETMDINSIVGIKGYLDEHGTVEIDKLTGLSIE